MGQVIRLLEIVENFKAGKLKKKFYNLPFVKIQKNLRIIPRLDIKGPNVVKGIQMEGLRVVGRGIVRSSLLCRWCRRNYIHGQ